MAASKKSLEKIKILDEKRRHDSDAKREWDKLVIALDRESFTQTPPDLKGPELTALIERLAEALDERGKQGSDDLDNCCGRGAVGDDGDDGRNGAGKLRAGIDMENLAELVFERLIFEVRIERERVGQSA
jgi:hypothetical protein